MSVSSKVLMIAFAASITVDARSDESNKSDITKSPVTGLGEISQPSPAALVQQVRESQKWIEQVDALHLRCEGTRSHPPASIELTAQKLRAKSQDVPLDSTVHSGLRPKVEETIEIAFDKRRFRRTFTQNDGRSELRLWDGVRGFINYHDSTESLIIEKSPHAVGAGLFNNIYWLWNQPLHFWWHSASKANQIRARTFKPDVFVVTGRTEYRNIPCYILHRRGWSLSRWYVGVKTGLLHGRMDDELPGNPDASEVAAKIAARHGKTLETEQDLFEWLESLNSRASESILMEFKEQCHLTAVPRQEIWLLDYQELKPGFWMPMTQGCSSYTGTHQKAVEEIRSDVQIVKATVNQPLDDGLFAATEILDGVKVSDRTTTPPLTYRQDSGRTQEEWDALRAEALRRFNKDAEAQADRDKLIGQAALKFPQNGWINGPPMTWNDLKGRHVVLIFWATWCGPCQGSIPFLRKMPEKSQMTIVGVHPPGTDTTKIVDVMNKRNADGPVFIDPPRGWQTSHGQHYAHYRLDGIPFAVLVDANGKIAGHGDLRDVFRMAKQLMAVRPK